MHCPRHRLPHCDSETQLLHASTFPCKATEYSNIIWSQIYRAKPYPQATTAYNSTLICIVLRCCGPLHERTLCLILLAIQIMTSIGVFWVRYVLFES